MNKTIHYIWLGGKKKPRKIKKCISGWKKKMPDWEIKEWNESNVDLDKYSFCREAYDAGKFAFAADVLRFEILFNEGGLYFDTDVKILKSLNDLTEKYEGFSGYEFNSVAPGLVLFCAKSGNQILAEMLEIYSKTHFIVNGEENKKVVGIYFSEVLEKHGFVYEDKEQCCDGFTVLPSTYFCPTDGFGNPMNFSENTYSVHLFAGSWLPLNKRCEKAIKSFFYRHLGREKIQKWMQLLKK